jgi:hypothetical protein
MIPPIISHDVSVANLNKGYLVYEHHDPIQLTKVWLLELLMDKWDYQNKEAIYHIF